jgi:hypothetical protein
MLQWRSAVSFEEIYDNSSRGWMEGLGFKIKTLPREVVTYPAPCDLEEKLLSMIPLAVCQMTSQRLSFKRWKG